jgi:hypothetical protein
MSPELKQADAKPDSSSVELAESFVESIPDTGVYIIHLDCGHSRRGDFQNKSVRVSTPTCGWCPGKPRRKITRLEFVGDSKPQEPPKEPALSYSDDIEQHLERLRRQLTEKDRELESAQGQIKTYMDTIAAKDATLRKYLSQVSNLTDAVQRAEHEVKTMRERQESWQQEQIQHDAEEHIRDIENNWRPQVELAEVKTPATSRLSLITGLP